MPGTLQLRPGSLREVAEPFDRGQPGPPLEPGWKRLAQQPRTGGRCYTRRRAEPALAGRVRADQQHRGLARAQRLGGHRDGLIGYRGLPVSNLPAGPQSTRARGLENTP